MARPLRTTTAAVIVYAVLVLLSVSPPAVAGQQQSCGTDCSNACQVYAEATCRGVASNSNSCLTVEQCKLQVFQPCVIVCLNGCNNGKPPLGTC
ncbi:hypothetical protein SEVIR_8G037600v4 [Setaria viridis]|uniref:Bifunctional inhibitor/plant lipid transfer protein/seed storage helical domain-containing protein n=1 Tax=Setaria viridis TaxID=4556 RepID=A0A4U6TF85_SETVI|nr:hypothetical protein SEVIR_8G037600v2 [Setaria viridis]